MEAGWSATESTVPYFVASPSSMTRSFGSLLSSGLSAIRFPPGPQTGGVVIALADVQSEVDADAGR